MCFKLLVISMVCIHEIYTFFCFCFHLQLLSHKFNHSNLFAVDVTIANNAHKTEFSMNLNRAVDGVVVAVATNG